MGSLHSVFARASLGLLLAVLLLPLSGCSSLGYYAHVSSGHMAVLGARQPIERVLADERTDAGLRERLAEVLEAREFASAHLQLPRNRSYTRYVELDRHYVVWNVFATQEFSLTPLRHCFPFAGCVPYRGWFDQARAQAYAERLRERGLETHVGGVAAYSTLGWFADPVLSTMLHWDEDELIGIVFHELAHQKLYVRGDAAFNESLAMFVQRQGLCEWRAARGRPPPDPAGQEWERDFVQRALALREALGRLYARPLAPEEMRRQREERIEAFRRTHRERWAARGGGIDPFGDWVARPINNAKLVPLGLYDRWVSAFRALFVEVGADWGRFHAAAAELAALPAQAREARLARYSDPSAAHCVGPEDSGEQGDAGMR